MFYIPSLQGIATPAATTATIVTSGLTIHLDAANSASYPGSGTTWTDLQGNFNVTLTNGPTFSDGAIVFDGTNDYGIFSPTDALYSQNDVNNNNAVSLNVWFKTSTLGIIVGQQSGSTPGSGNAVPAIYIDTDNKLRTSVFWTGNTQNTLVSSASVATNTWQNACATFESGTHKTYLNGTEINTVSSRNQSSYSSSYNYFLGTGRWENWPGGTDSLPNNQYFNGSIAVFQCYNRALSAAEVLQNFNALKGRYGL
jgi:hypothetical protein